MTRIRAQCEADLVRSCLWCVVHPLSCSGIHCLANGTIVNCGRVRVFCFEAQRVNETVRVVGGSRDCELYRHEVAVRHEAQHGI